MPYNEETRAMLNAYKRETDAQIFALQKKIYELQSRLFSLEMERYIETRQNSEINDKHRQTL